MSNLLTRCWQVHDVKLRAAGHFDDPYNDVSLTARITAPDGRELRVPGFWDGDQTWRFRCCPDLPGTWRWATTCRPSSDRGLDGRTGSFTCVPYEGSNNLYRHGLVGLSADRRRFAHADGKPFFWLGDTCWNGVLRSTARQWDRYLRIRRQQGFTVVHHFSTTWRGLAVGHDGRRAFELGPPVRVDPLFFQTLDRRVLEINRHGLLAAPIMALALYAEDEGWALTEPDLERLCRYLIARWGAFHVVWTIGGDGDFSGHRAERWRRIGRRLAQERQGRLMSMHPKGLMWNADEFRQEHWFDLVEYQSCHFASPESVAWMVKGPLAREWRREPPRPILNVEPNYEEHPALDTGYVFTDRDVRRAAYWSVLLAPTSGVSYGNFNVWSWSGLPEDFRVVLREMSSGWLTIGPWHSHLDTPGARSMTILRELMTTGPWFRLRPAPEILGHQPGERDPAQFQAAASTDEGDWALVYLPHPGSVELSTPERHWAARWFDPRGATWREAHPEGMAFVAPGDGDWVLDLRH
ncbi:MAG: apiosidase-like domain-containing protein [Candidatus Dormibacteraceae bacterium]